MPLVQAFTQNQGHLAKAAAYLPRGFDDGGLGARLIVSTTWVFGWALASFTGVNFPVSALRPIFML